MRFGEDKHQWRFDDGRGDTSQLHRVRHERDSDKQVRRITLEGLEFMRTAVKRGNFEAPSFYGLLASSHRWSSVRKALGVEESIGVGIRLIIQALQNGDVLASIDLANMIISV